MEDTYSIAIKNMVCSRCIAVVRSIAAEAGIELVSISLGEVFTRVEPTADQLQSFSESLEVNDFSIVVSKERKLINKIKTLVLKRIQNPETNSLKKLSTYLAEGLRYDYGYLSKVFSSVEALTIERYFTLQRMERAKELLSYDELNVTEIAEQLDFSSAAHFSAQFKQETGMPPSQFKRTKSPARRALDSI